MHSATSLKSYIKETYLSERAMGCAQKRARRAKIIPDIYNLTLKLSFLGGGVQMLATEM